MGYFFAVMVLMASVWGLVLAAEQLRADAIASGVAHYECEQTKPTCKFTWGPPK